jgi:hypothetical protein
LVLPAHQSQQYLATVSYNSKYWEFGTCNVANLQSNTSSDKNIAGFLGHQYPYNGCTAVMKCKILAQKSTDVVFEWYKIIKALCLQVDFCKIIWGAYEKYHFQLIKFHRLLLQKHMGGLWKYTFHEW